MKRVVRVLGVVIAISRLLTAGAVVWTGFLWRRYWAIRTFKRSLRRAELPRDVVREFTRDYRRAANLSTSKKRGLNRKE